MARRAVLFYVLALSCGAARAQTASAPLTPAQKALVGRMAEYAREYRRQLPDFVCTRITRRSRDKSGSGEFWQPLDTAEEELTFVKGRESYRLVKYNGKPVKPKGQATSGFKSSGEFAGYLAEIFAQDANAEFQWERDEDSAGRHTSVFRFRVAREHSRSTVGAGAKEEVVGIGGLLYAAGDTGAVERMHIQTDEPEGVKAGGITTDVRFVEVTIAGERYRLPGQAEARIGYKGRLLKREMEFRDYHKYAADSSVVFEETK